VSTSPDIVFATLQGFLSQCAIGSIIRHTLQRAGIQAPTTGAHQFRHALATQMLRHGASLTEIGEVLRHRHPQTTAIYAKVDLQALRTLALRWPGGAR
jgi:integrase/recombinase XerD